VKSDSARRDALWLAGLLALVAAAGLFRPLLPIDETRYASVAWEMWSRGDFLVPFRNGEPYHHKPPLLFWLIHAGWAVFGVNEWWPKLISPLFAAGTLMITARLGREFWPQRPEVARMAPFVLLACLLFSYFAAALMFDAMISFFVALGFLGLVRAWKTGGGVSGFVLLSLGLGGALYAKGPVALLHLLPLALFAPWWMRESRPRWGRWYGGVLLALLGGAAMILAWAIPAGLAGGEEYRNAIFWGQTAGRMAKSFAHQAPWWFYLAWLPVMLAPWLLWPRWWGGLRRGLLSESGVRFALFGALFCLVFFSFVSGKRWHYLLPEFALFALIAARALADRLAGRWSLTVPGLTVLALGVGAFVAAPRVAARLGGLDDASALYWGGAVALVAALGLLTRRPGPALSDVRRVATAMIVAVAGLLAAFDVAMREPYDVDSVAGKLAVFEREGRPIAIEGEYHGQWHLAGRLQRPLTELLTEAVPGWLAQHPQGRLIFIYRDPQEIPPGARVEYTRRYRGAWLAILAPGAAPAPAAPAAAPPGS
jgi:4-amino-4-deoxy-L-arabinose transferase-like glycosyltransferase